MGRTSHRLHHLEGCAAATEGVHSHVRKEESSQVNDLTFPLKKLGKKEEIKPEVHRIKEITKIKAETDKIKKKKNTTVEKANKTISCLFEKINKMDKPLARLVSNKQGNKHIKEADD